MTRTCRRTEIVFALACAVTTGCHRGAHARDRGPTVTLMLSAPGIDAAHIASEQMLPIERALSTIPNFARIDGIAAPGHGRIVIELGGDPDPASTIHDVETAVRTTMRRLAPGTMPPLVTTSTSSIVARFAVADPATAERAARDLESEPGVGPLTICGSRTPEFWIEVDPRQLTATGTTVVDVIRALQKAMASTPRELLDAELDVRHSPHIKLRDLAQLREVEAPRCLAFDAHGARAVLEVRVHPGANLDRMTAVISKYVRSPPLPDLRDVVVDWRDWAAPAAREPRLAALRGAVAAIPGIGVFAIEDGEPDDPTLAHVQVAGDDLLVGAVIDRLRRQPTVAAAGEPSAVIELASGDATKLAAAAHALADRLAHDGALVATRGLATDPTPTTVIDEAAASRAGFDPSALAQAAAARAGMYVTTTLPANLSSRGHDVIVHVAPTTVPPGVRLGDEPDPVDRYGRVTIAPTPREVVHANLQPAVLIYASGDESAARAAVADLHLGAEVRVTFEPAQ